MRVVLCASLLCCLPLPAQIPASTPDQSTKPAQPTTPPASAHQTTRPPAVEDSEIGFSYSLPTDWQFVPEPEPPKVVVPYPAAVGPPKGDACVKLVLSAQRGTPVSTVVVTEIPFSCYGETIVPADLQDFGIGAEEGLRQTFKVTERLQGRYELGIHSLWIERAKGAPKAHPGDSYTFETVCTILTKGVVCWTAMAADAASLQAFEHAPVSLEGDHRVALVPPHVFLSKP